MLEEKIRLLTLASQEPIKEHIYDSLLKHLSYQFDGGIVYIDENGVIRRAYSKYESEILGKNVSYREYFIQTKKTLKPYVSEGFRTIVGKDAVLITVPIVKNNRFKGLIAGAIELKNQRIGYLIASSRFYKTGNIIIVDNKGMVLFSEDPTEIGKIFTKFPLYSSGYREIKIDDRDYIVGIRAIPNTQWRIIASIEKRDILSHSYENLRFGTVISISLFILLVLFLTLVLRKFLSYLYLLRNIATEYARGNYSQDVNTSPFREINDIINAHKTMGEEIKEREERIKEEQTYLETLLLDMGEGVFVLDADKRFVFVNKSFLEITGYTEEELNKINPLEIFAPEYREKILETCYKNERCRERVELISKDGRNIPVLCSVSPIKLNGITKGHLVVTTDLTEIKKKEKELEDAMEEIKALNEMLTMRSQQLEIALAKLDMQLLEMGKAKENAEKLAVRDPLTGLFNRRYLEERFNNEIIKAKAYNKFISIVMADIDHFKRINDTYGHSVGDDVLKSIALILRASVRENDIVARYGGEEFVILLDNVSKYDAYKIAERIRQEIQETSFEEIGVVERITVSFGISCFPEDGETPMDLLIKADQALYRAKSLGRNRVEVYTKPSESIHF